MMPKLDEKCQRGAFLQSRAAGWACVFLSTWLTGCGEDSAFTFGEFAKQRQGGTGNPPSSGPIQESEAAPGSGQPVDQRGSAQRTVAVINPSGEAVPAHGGEAAGAGEATAPSPTAGVDAQLVDADREEWDAACGKGFEGSAPVLRVTGSQNNVRLGAGEALAVRVTGNQNAVHMALVAQPVAEDPALWDFVPAICLFSAGNLSAINVRISGLRVGKVVIVGRGNQPRFDVQVEAGVSVSDWQVDLKGNNGLVRVGVPAESVSAVCPLVLEQKQKHGSISCAGLTPP